MYHRAAVNIRPLTVAQFLDELAAKTPIPGGGAAASLTGALASALASMVVAYSLGKKNLADHQPVLEAAAAELVERRERFLSLAEEDAAAYAELNAALRLDKADPLRLAGLERASRASIAAPMRTLEHADALLRLCETLSVITNKNLRSDLGIAAALASSAACACHWNIAVNAPILDEAAPGDGALAMATANRLVADCRKRAHRVESLCASPV